MRTNYKSKGFVPIDQVLPLLEPVVTPTSRTLLLGSLVRTGSLRLVTFKTRGTKCCVCGIEGVFFSVEKPIRDRTAKSYHINLYTEVNGGHRLITADHIVARSDGGSNRIENMQTMCCICNGNKGSVTDKINQYFNKRKSLQSSQYRDCVAI